MRITTITSWDSSIPSDVEHYEDAFLNFSDAYEFAEQVIIERNEDATIEKTNRSINDNLMHLELHAYVEDEVIAIMYICEQEIF